MNLPAHLTIKQINKVLKRCLTLGIEKFYRLVHSFSLPTYEKVGRFSRGMSMKLSIAVALSHNANY